VDLEFNFEKRYRLIREIIETLILTILMFLIIRLAVQNFNIDGTSMEPNLHNQELVLVDKWSYLFHPPARGDVIVFVAPPDPAQDYIKRVIGLPGDVITVHGTQVYVNGTLLKEAYVSPQREGNPYAPITNMIVPPNSYFVLGDNRAGSSDSRNWGCVPRQNIIGRAALVYWPLGQSNDGLLPKAVANYQAIGAPPTKGINPNHLCPIMNPNAVPATANQSIFNKIFNNATAGSMVIVLLPCFTVGYSRRRRRISTL
jgi:signal peptidase I